MTGMPSIPFRVSMHPGHHPGMTVSTVGHAGIRFANVTSISSLGGGGFLTPTASEVYSTMALYPSMTPEEIAAQQAAEQQALAQAQAQQSFLQLPSRHPNFLKADPKQPDTLGWREWVWDGANKCLRSPSQGTLWPTDRHVADKWSKDDAVRGVAGIHALLVPRHWKLLTEFDCFPLGGGAGVVTGVVERFGKYVLGTEGWRAEEVIIRELLAPTTEIGLALEQKYPDVIVHYPDQLEEGDQSCKSEKSSEWGKGNRPRSASLLSNLLHSNGLIQSPSSPPSLTSSPAPSPQLIRWLSSPTPPSASLQGSPPKSELQKRLDRFWWVTALWIMVGCGWLLLLGVRIFAH